MPIIELPLRADLTHYDFELSLDGVAYVFELRWNIRDDAWYLDLRLADGTDVVNGAKIVLEWPIGSRCKHASRPPGMLVAFDSSGRREEARIDDLGTRVRVLYFDEEATDELRESLGIG
jgi:hypothetical protein